MFNETVVYVDIETTGGSYRSSSIIEIAAIKVQHGKAVDTFVTFINPGTPVPYHITQITGITSADLVHAPFFADIATELHEFLRGAIFIAHHVRFDYSFIKKQFGNSNISYNPKMLCSVRLSRALFPEDRGHGLEAIIKRFNIQTKARHRAYDDAEAVRQFLNLAYELRGKEEFEKAVTKQLKHRSLPPNLDDRGFDHIPNTPGVYTFLDSGDAPIYIGKSVSLRRRIMSHFSQDTAIDKEMKLSLNTHKITYVETANELEALLVESQMIKEKLPVYNRKLRMTKKMYILSAKTTEDGYKSIVLDNLERDQIRPDNTIYGVFSNKRSAINALDNAGKTFELCPKLLGLEKTTRTCFKFQLGKCGGACQKTEHPSEYNKRFEIAFSKMKLEKWPFDKPVILDHADKKNSDKRLVIDNWNVIGEIETQEGCDPYFKPWQLIFDIDTYKIIRSYFSYKSSAFKLLPITYDELEAIH